MQGSSWEGPIVKGKKKACTLVPSCWNWSLCRSIFHARSRTSVKETSVKQHQIPVPVLSYHWFLPYPEIPLFRQQPYVFVCPWFELWSMQQKIVLCYYSTVCSVVDNSRGYGRWEQKYTQQHVVVRAHMRMLLAAIKVHFRKCLLCRAACFSPQVWATYHSRLYKGWSFR